jgi:hypothetical protein
MPTYATESGLLYVQGVPTVSSEKREELKAEEDNRAPWERPELRRLDTKYAEHFGHCQDEGNTKCTKDMHASFGV